MNSHVVLNNGTRVMNSYKARFTVVQVHRAELHGIYSGAAPLCCVVLP